METTTDNNSRRENGDLHAHLAMMQVVQSDMMQQISQLFGNFNQLVKELEETKRKQANQQQLMKSMAQYISQQNGGASSFSFLFRKKVNEFVARTFTRRSRYRRIRATTVHLYYLS